MIDSIVTNRDEKKVLNFLAELQAVFTQIKNVENYLQYVNHYYFC